MLIIKKILLLLFLSTIFFSSAFSKTIKIISVYDGKINSTIHIKEHGQVRYISIDDLCKIFKSNYRWYPVSKKVFFHVKDQIVVFSLLKKHVRIRNKNVVMKHRVLSTKTKIYIPLNFVLNNKEFFALLKIDKITWNKNYQVLYITSKMAPSFFRIKQSDLKTTIFIQFPRHSKVMMPKIKKNGSLVGIFFQNVKMDIQGTIQSKNKILKKISVQNIANTAKILVYKNSKSIKKRVFFNQEKNIYTIAFYNREKVEKKSRKNKKSKKTTNRRKTDFVNKKIKKIVIDAGHGGMDPGAIGQLGTKEKKINLQVSKLFYKYLKARGFEVYLTRTKDTFISLQKRCVIANKQNADLFLSIHCNASINKKARGFEIYFFNHVSNAKQLSNKLERFENTILYPSIQEVYALESSKHRFVKQSNKLAQFMQKQLQTSSSIPYRSIQNARFYVLKHVQMPALLLELGFISNSKEERMLRNRTVQLRLIKHIFLGILHYNKQMNG